MAIAISLQQYLASAHVPYDVVKHKSTSNVIDTAYKAHIPLEELVKAVILKNTGGHFLMAMLPATSRLKLPRIKEHLQQHYQLASEQDLKHLFTDCKLSAIPAIGDAYHMPSIYDEQLLDEPSVYIEGGDQQALIKLDHHTFKKLTDQLPHAYISELR